MSQLFPEVDEILALSDYGKVTKVLLLGNSGVGKSMLLNVLQSRPAFESKHSHEAVTKEVEVEVYHATEGDDAFLLYNIPGLLDPDQTIAKRNAAEIEKAIRDHERVPVVTFFVLTVEGGRLRVDDLEAWQAIVKFVPDIRDKTALAFIVNKVDFEEFEDKSQREAYELNLRRNIQKYCDGAFDIHLLPNISKKDRENFKSDAAVQMRDRLGAAMRKLRGKSLNVPKGAHLELHVEQLKAQIEETRKRMESMQRSFDEQAKAKDAQHQQALDDMRRDNEEMAARTRAEHQRALDEMKHSIRESEARHQQNLETLRSENAEARAQYQRQIDAMETRSRESNEMMQQLQHAQFHANAGQAMYMPHDDNDFFDSMSRRSHGSHHHSHHATSSSRGSHKMTWNQFQHSVGGQGYSKRQISKMYKSYKSK